MKQNNSHRTTRRHIHDAEREHAFANGLIEVELQYEAPRAEKVYVAGEFNQWRAGDLRLRQDETGLWKVQLWLTPGWYEYRFLVDGEWHDDPRAKVRVSNAFGSTNSVLVVQAPVGTPVAGVVPRRDEISEATSPSRSMQPRNELIGHA